MSSERNVFKMLWKMYHECRKDDEKREYGMAIRDNKGMIISRYASIIDDRIEGSNYCRSIDGLALYSTEQLKEELASRKNAKLKGEPNE